MLCSCCGVKISTTRDSARIMPTTDRMLKILRVIAHAPPLHPEQVVAVHHRLAGKHVKLYF